MRAFLAIRLDPPESVVRLMDDLERSGADLKLVSPRHLHLTLKFLGEIPDTQVVPILAALGDANFPQHYDVTLEDVGAFPDWKRLRVLWVGLADPEGHVARSFALSEQTFATLGFPVEGRAFRAHVTIARKRSDRGKDAVRRLLEPQRGTKFGTCHVDAPHLFKSTLSPEGPIYESLGSVGG